MPRAAIVAAALIGLLLTAAPQSARADAVAFQANPAHTGDAGDVGLRLPLRRAWQVRLPGDLSFPVAAGGRVFVMRNLPGSYAGTEVVAVSIATGAVLWRRQLGVRSRGAGLAYGDGRVVAVRDTDLEPVDRRAILAFDARDGSVLWHREASLFQAAPPVVDRGAVFVNGIEAPIAALRLSDGATLWTHGGGAGAGSVAVDGDSVYAMDSDCPDLRRLRRADGATVWDSEHGCNLSEESTPVVYRGRVYTLASEWETPFLRGVFDAASGSLVQRVRLDDVPAFSGRVGVFPFRGDARADQIGHTLVARDLSTNRVRWRFRGDGYLDSAPLIASGIVFVGSGSGRLYGIRLRDGRRVWRASARTQVPAPGRGLAGLAAAERTLFVPALGRLTAYR